MARQRRTSRPNARPAARSPQALPPLRRPPLKRGRGQPPAPPASKLKDPEVLRAIAAAKLGAADAADDIGNKVRNKKHAAQLRAEAAMAERRAEKLEAKAAKTKPPAAAPYKDAPPARSTALVRQAKGPSTAIARRGVASDLGRAVELADHSTASNTQRAYKADWEDWCLYAEAEGLQVFPVKGDALCAYIGHMDSRGLAVATIRRRCSAIAHRHRGQRGQDGNPAISPTDDARVRTVLKGLARVRTVAQKGKRAMEGSTIRAVILSPDFPLRDKAMLAVCYVTGMRRSELVALKRQDVQVVKDGVVLTIVRSKADQEGEGALVGVPALDEDPQVCPVRVLKAWLEAMAQDGRGQPDAVIFPVSEMTVARAVKRAAELVGHDPTEYGAHSLRAGLATTAAGAGVSLGESMLATRHKSANVAARYVRVSSAANNLAHLAATRSLSKASAKEITALLTPAERSLARKMASQQAREQGASIDRVIAARGVRSKPKAAVPKAAPKRKGGKPPPKSTKKPTRAARRDR